MARKEMVRKELDFIREAIRPKKDKRMFTLFFVVVFSLLIAMTRAIDNMFIALFFQAVLIFTQIVLVKNLLDSLMGED
jgi:hypothetical protein